MAQARLSPYLSSTDAGGQTLTMHVAYGNGAVMVNGQKIGSLPPVDRAQLEEPARTFAGSPTGAGGWIGGGALDREVRPGALPCL